MKQPHQNQIGRGIGIGFGIFLVLSALCLLTPLRRPLLAVAGSDTPSLQFRLDAQRHVMDSLQTLSSSVRLTPAERASLDQVREAYVATRERVDARERMNARFSLLGLFDWVSELAPWLLAFGVALPVLGGLVGAQAHAGNQKPVQPASQPSDRTARPAPSPTPPPPPPAPPARRTAYVHPAVLAATGGAPVTPVTAPEAPSIPQSASALRPLPGSPVVLPPDILTPPATQSVTPKVPARPAVAEPPAASVDPASDDWGFRHQPTPLESRPRPKMPPVRSSHLTDLPDGDPDENSGV